jgi:hypothetical protein
MAIRVSSRLIPLLAFGAYLAACGNAGDAHAGGCDFVAARDGSDRNGGTVDRPFKTAQRLSDALGPGETGCLRSGTYTETPRGPHVLEVQRGGRQGAPVTIRSFPGERAKLNGIVWVPKGSDFVTLSGLDFDGRGGEVSGDPVSIQLMGRDTILENSDITNRRLKSCVIIGSNRGFGQARRVVIRGNVFRDCGSPANGIHDHGIYAENVRGGEITGNVFYGSAAWAIQLYPNAHGIRVTRNVMDSNRGGVIVAGEGRLASTGNLIERNVITNNRGARPVSTYWGDAVGSGNVARLNCVDSSGGSLRDERGLSIAGNVTADPRYADRGRRDYRLSAGSACRALLGSDLPAARMSRRS